MASASAITASATGIAGGVVTIFNEWLFPMLHVVAMNTNVQAAWILILTAMFGHYFSLRTQNQNLNLFLKDKGVDQKFKQVYNWFEQNSKNS